MEKKQRDLSDKLPLSVVPEQNIQCIYCGSKDYRLKEKITRKDGTVAKAFKCKQCHKNFEIIINSGLAIAINTKPKHTRKFILLVLIAIAKTISRGVLLSEKMALLLKDWSVNSVIKPFPIVIKSILSSFPWKELSVLNVPALIVLKMEK